MNGCKANLARVVRNGNVETMTAGKYIVMRAGFEKKQGEEGASQAEKIANAKTPSTGGGLGYIHCDCGIARSKAGLGRSMQRCSHAAVTEKGWRGLRQRELCSNCNGAHWSIWTRESIWPDLWPVVVMGKMGERGDQGDQVENRTNGGQE